MKILCLPRRAGRINVLSDAGMEDSYIENVFMLIAFRYLP